MAVAYQQGSIQNLSLVGLYGVSLTLPSFSQHSVQFSLPSPTLLPYHRPRQFFINQWYSQHTEGNPTSSVLAEMAPWSGRIGVKWQGLVLRVGGNFWNH